MRMQDAFEVIVVGGGGSGLAAATTAAQAGARTLLIERQPSLGGTTAISTGLLSAAGTDAQQRAGIAGDSPAVHFDDMERTRRPHTVANNSVLRRILAEQAPATVNWLERLGVTFAGPFPAEAASIPRMLVPLPNAGTYIFHLARAFRRAGGCLLTGMDVEDLLLRDGRVAGVLASGRSFAATRAVILASGDFSANAKLRHRYLPQYDRMPAINPGSVGSGFEIALRHGAEILNGELVRAGQLRFPPPPGRGSLIARLPPWRALAIPMRLAMRHAPSWLLKPIMMPFLATYLAPEATLFRHGALLIDAEGRRFTDETREPGIPLSEQPGGRAYIVIDSRIGALFERAPNALSSAPGMGHAFLRDYHRYRPDLVLQADNLVDLATKMRVPADTLTATVAARNAEIEGRNGEALPLTEAPFHALGPVQAAISTTMGGLRVDEVHRVLRPDGTPLPGLMAVGSAGYGGLVIVGQGHNLAWAFTSGRLAGQAAAAGKAQT